MKKSIGIDLGTTYCCVMHYEADGSEELVPTDMGAPLTPSIVHISSDGEVTVGEDARDLLLEDADNVIVGIKREMGREYSLEYGGQLLTPEGISALILNQLGNDAARVLNVPYEELSCVITIPAYFGVAEREATAAAARIANLHWEELLPEPVAAAYAYGLAEQPNLTSLVFDLGGGTFDVAVVGMVRGHYRVWAVDGESRLGGLDWDARIEDLLWEEVEQLPDGEDLLFDEDVIGAVHDASERVKRKLSGVDKVTERIRIAGQTITLRISRDRFEEVTYDLLLRSLQATRRVMETANAAGAPPVDQILLIGGSTRMPMIREALTREFGLPVRLTDPDKAVARGAAIMSEQLLAAKERRTVKLGETTVLASSANRVVSVLPRSIGVRLYSSQGPYTDEPYIQHFLPANTPLPIARHRHSVSTIVDNQESVRIELFEQGGNVPSPRVEDNRPLIEGEISGIPPSPAGSEVQLIVSVSVDGLVSLEASTARGRATLHVEAFVHGVLDEQEVEKQKRVTSLLLRGK